MSVNPLSNNLSCTQKALLQVNDNSTLQKDAADFVKEDFEDSPDFEYVYLNMNSQILYKTWMSDGNTEDKILGYKKMFSYPYLHIKFDIGYYVFFDYYHVGEHNMSNWSCWLLYSLNYQNYYDVVGKCYPCNENVKWLNNLKETLSYPCYMEDSMKYTTLNLGQQGFTEPDCDIVAFLQNNDDTTTIYINQRFLFNGRAYVVVQKNIEINKKVIKLFLNKVAEQPNDDIINNIAWNGESVVNPVTPTTSEILLLPNINSITLNQTVDFNVYEYINGVKTSAQFDINISGLDVAYYQFTLIDSNNFSIKNLKQNTQKPLIITYTNKDNIQEVNTKEIWLKGVF